MTRRSASSLLRRWTQLYSPPAQLITHSDTQNTFVKIMKERIGAKMLSEIEADFRHFSTVQFVATAVWCLDTGELFV